MAGGVRVRITTHARERMKKYLVSEAFVKKTLKEPSSVVEGHSDRMIAQRKIDGYVLRVVFKKELDTFIVITVYKARSERYEI